LVGRLGFRRHPVLGSQAHGLVRVLGEEVGVFSLVISKQTTVTGGLHVLSGTGALKAHRYLTDYAESYWVTITMTSLLRLA
jgi:hypothetical protein